MPAFPLRSPSVLLNRRGSPLKRADPAREAHRFPPTQHPRLFDLYWLGLGKRYYIRRNISRYGLQILDLRLNIYSEGEIQQIVLF